MLCERLGWAPGVSVILGHSSIRVTEKYYSPWVRARQEQLEADVRATWGREALVLAETKGTPEVHGKMETVNRHKLRGLLWL